MSSVRSLQRQESDQNDYGLLYRPIRFRTTPPAGLYKARPARNGEIAPSPSRAGLFGGALTPTAQRPPSALPYRRSPPRTFSRSPSILDNYIPTKLRWKSEDPAVSNADALSSVRSSAARRTEARGVATPRRENYASSTTVTSPPRFSPRQQPRTLQYMPPSLRYALVIMTTLEVEARAAVVSEESTQFGEIIQQFRFALELECVRVAAFKLFHLERRARTLVGEQESRERAIIDFWQSDEWQDVQVRRTIGWQSNVAAIAATPAGESRGASSLRKQIVADMPKRRADSRSAASAPAPSLKQSYRKETPPPRTPPSPRTSPPLHSEAHLPVCDEVEIDEGMRHGQPRVSSPEPDLIARLWQQSFDRLPIFRSSSPEDELPVIDVPLNVEPVEEQPLDAPVAGASAYDENGLAAMLVQEQLLDARIAQQRAAYLSPDGRAPNQNYDLARDRSRRAVRTRLTALFD